MGFAVLTEGLWTEKEESSKHHSQNILKNIGVIKKNWGSEIRATAPEPEKTCLLSTWVYWKGECYKIH